LSFPDLHRRAGRLRVLVLAVSDRCDQRCLHCDIWRGSSGSGSLSLAERLAILDDASRDGLEALLLTGGEPLLSPDLWPLAERARVRGVRLLLATNGLQLARFAADVARLFAEVFVSLDGGEAATHDALRGVGSADRLRAGLAAVRAQPVRPKLVARSVLHARNLDEVEAVVASAAQLGFDHVSFLALDAASTAFGGRPGRRAGLVPELTQVARFEEAIRRLEAAGALRSGFVLESAEKLRRLAGHLRASAGELPFVRPDCDAPLWSSVVEADGRVRPCFFHEAVGDARDGLARVRGSRSYSAALRHIRAANPTCERCVCPKRRARVLRWGRTA
jgi:MoaA/NifB/PqqE/SkfB family radical SAM enzyme